MKTLWGYWPHLVVAALAFGLAYLLFGVGTDNSSELKAAKRAEASAKKLADDYKAQAESWHRKFIADTTGDYKRAQDIAASAKKATALRAVTHPTVRKPNAFLNPKASRVSRDSAVLAADAVLSHIAQP